MNVESNIKAEYQKEIDSLLLQSGQQNLTQALMAELVHRIINRIYCCEYIGRLEVTELCNLDG